MAISKSRGFTLLELLVVIAVIALGSAGVAMAMRDSGQASLEREALRLSALLDVARSQSRATGAAITWQAITTETGTSVMQWHGLPSKEPLPTHWLDAGIKVNAAQGRPPLVVLGPEPVMAPVRLHLQLGSSRLDVVTDGVGEFHVE